MEQTIAALATPPGEGGIAVIRISGRQAYEIAQKVFQPAKQGRQLSTAAGYTAMLGHFIQNGTIVDEVVALCFRAPRSYTGEDVVELSCHGGTAVSELLLRACFEAGAAPALAGEFTRRAFLNGRISLTQAEAVMDLIGATGRQAAAAAAAVMQGALYQKIQTVQQHLVGLAGHLAAFIDYPEEDVPQLNAAQLRTGLLEDIQILKQLIDGYDTGAVVRRGVKAVIAGSPNVGKSTLMNLLTGCERAIVTPIAGTTRDVIEQEIMLAGIRIQLADTAGLRQTDDVAEAEGIRRSHLYLQQAGLILAVFDASTELSAQDFELAQQCRGRTALAVLNKNDLPCLWNRAVIEDCFCAMVSVCAQQPQARTQLEQAVAQTLGTANVDTDALLLANERQLEAAQAAYTALCEARQALDDGMTLDAAGVCIQDALSALYALTGEQVSEEIINEVFSSFCVGK